MITFSEVFNVQERFGSVHRKKFMECKNPWTFYIIEDGIKFVPQLPGYTCGFATKREATAYLNKLKKGTIRSVFLIYSYSGGGVSTVPIKVFDSRIKVFNYVTQFDKTIDSHTVFETFSVNVYGYLSCSWMHKMYRVEEHKLE